MRQPNLCASCSTLFTREWTTLKDKPRTINFSGRKASLLEPNGCRLCPQLYYIMEKEFKSPYPDLNIPYSTGDDEFTMRFEEGLEDEDNLETEQLHASEEIKVKMPALWVNRPSFYMHQFRMAAKSTSAAAQFIPTRPPLSDPASDLTYSFVEDWIKDCDKNHNCMLQSTLLPKGVIKVGNINSGTVRLIEMSHLQNRYVALSYCWGNTASDRQVLTFKQNLADHLRGIDLADLPKTIQDAVVVTRRLKLEYLWVDALCIIQDDHQDKADQIPIMGDIYGNAYFTISAASSVGCGDGFLKPSTSLTFIPVPYRLPNGVIDEVLLEDPQRRKTSIYKQEKIHGRGWTLQETLLSPRILFYSTLQPYWKCRLVAKAAGIPSARKYFLSTTLLDLFETFGEGKVHSNNFARNENVSPWGRLVEYYSQRHLSYHDDRLPAIAGIAKRYSQMTGDEFLVGLWRSTLPMDLAWEVGLPGGAYHVEGTTRKSFGSASSIPSWSWISQISRISYGFSANSLPKGAVSCVSEVSSISSDGIGYLVNGPLRLRGKIKNAVIPRLQGFSGYWFSFDRTVWDAEKNRFTLPDLTSCYLGVANFDDEACKPGSPIAFDKVDMTAEPLTCPCVVIGHSDTVVKDRVRRPVWKALILAQVSQTPLAYRRMGLLSGLADEASLYFSDATETVFELH